MSDSCGYIALDHGLRRPGSRGNAETEGVGGREEGRVIVAFRGTYSIANTIVDLSTVPQEYVPYPGSPDNSSQGEDGSHRRPMVGREGRGGSWRDWVPRWRRQRAVSEGIVDLSTQKAKKRENEGGEVKCMNCTVHTGFWTSWQNTRPFILPYIKLLQEKYPDYRLHLVGHSLGGAVAALAGLEFESLGFEPTITTFGEPKVGNAGLRDYIDATFGLPSEHEHDREDGSSENRALESGRYRRVTHVDDPVPLLPLQEWGYRSHAGEHFISKPELQPAITDIRLCYGDEDVDCLAAAEVDESWFNHDSTSETVEVYNENQGDVEFEREGGRGDGGVGEGGIEKRWGLPIPARYKMWQLFFAHRDYFWRLGLCVPGGDPLDWGRDKYKYGDGEVDNEEAGKWRDMPDERVEL